MTGTKPYRFSRKGHTVARATKVQDHLVSRQPFLELPQMLSLARSGGVEGVSLPASNSLGTSGGGEPKKTGNDVRFGFFS